MNAIAQLRSRIEGRRGWLALCLSVGAYAAVGLLTHQPFHLGLRGLRYFDLQIYRGAAVRARHGIPLYATPIHDGLGFTYPPFAALVMLPLAFVPLRVDELGVTAINLALLVWVMHSARRLASRRADVAVGRARAWSIAALLAAAAVWLEPVSGTLGYGQINLLIAALVVADLARSDEARTKGIGIGLAAALKLTPLLFIAYLLFSGRRRAAAIAGATVAASIAVAYAALGGDANRYWEGRLFLDSSRIGGASDTSDQSLHGALVRLSPHITSGYRLELVIACVAAAGLALAVHHSRRGDEGVGFALTALTALLVSPISWTHHWTLAVPALAVLGNRARERRSRTLWAATAALVALGYAYVLEWAGPVGHARGLITLLTDDPYVLVAAITLVFTAVPILRRRVSRAAHTPREAIFSINAR